MPLPVCPATWPAAWASRTGLQSQSPTSSERSAKVSESARENIACRAPVPTIA